MRYTKDKRRGWRFLLLPLFFVLGFSRTGSELARREAERAFGLAETGREVCAEGRVVRITERETRIEYLLEEVRAARSVGEEEQSGQIGRLLAEISGDVRENGVEEGDRIRVSGILGEFETADNPGQFDYAAYQAAQGVFLRLSGGRLLSSSGGEPFWGWVGSLRRRGTEILLAASPEEGGTMAALVLGEKSALPDGRYQLYLDSGVGHILTLSGLHLSLFGAGLYGLLRRRMTVPAWPSALVSGVVILVYVRMTGSGISASRAAAALLCSVLAGCLGKTYDALSAAGLGMILILSEYPLQITQTSFWYSFGAVIALGGVLPELTEWTGERNRILKAFLVSFTVWTALAPVNAAGQYTLQPYSMLLNVLVVPLAGVLIGLSAAALAAGMFSLRAAALPALAVRCLLAGLDGLCRISLRLPGGNLCTGSPGFPRMAAYAAVCGVFLAFVIRSNRKAREGEPRRDGKTGRRRYAALLAAGCLAAVCLLIRPGRELTMVFLDVGQGDCVCIRTPSGVSVVVDGGSSSEKKVGEYRIGPCLAWAGIGEIDYLVMTHLDADHINGLTELIASGFPIRTLLLSSVTTEPDKMEEIILTAEKNQIKVVKIKKNDRIIAGKVEIKCVYPDIEAAPDSENGASAVLELTYGAFSCLLTGDLEGSGESKTAKYLAGQPPITLLKVAHHGSRYSTGEDFLAAAAPSAAVISCGRDNPYGHPHAELLERLRAADCGIWCTAECGAVIVRTDGKSWRVEGYRRSR